MAFIARFNQISAWVASIVLWEESVRKRKKKLTRIIELNLVFYLILFDLHFFVLLTLYGFFIEGCG
jgi:hypothetical protein